MAVLMSKFRMVRDESNLSCKFVFNNFKGLTIDASTIAAILSYIARANWRNLVLWGIIHTVARMVWVAGCS